MRNLRLFLAAAPVLAAALAYGSQASAQEQCSCGCATTAYYPPAIVGGNAGDVAAYYANDGTLTSTLVSAAGFQYRHVAIQYDYTGEYVTQATWNGNSPATGWQCADPIYFTGVNSLQALLPGVQNDTTIQTGSGVRLPSAGSAYCNMPFQYYEIAAFATPGAWDCATTLNAYCGVGSYNPRGSHLPTDGQTPYSRFWSYGQEYYDWMPSLAGAPGCPIQGGCTFSNYHQISGDNIEPAAEALYQYAYNEGLTAGTPWYISMVCGGVGSAGMANRAANQLINEALYTSGNQNYDYNTWSIGGDPTSTPDWVVDYSEYVSGRGAAGLSINSGGYECSSCNSCAATPTISCVENDNTGSCGSVPAEGSYITVWGSNFGSSSNAVILDGYYLDVTYNSATQINAYVNYALSSGGAYLYVYDYNSGYESPGSYVTVSGSGSSAPASCSSGYTCAEYSSYCAANSCCSFGSWSCESDGCLYDTGCVY